MQQPNSFETLLGLILLIIVIVLIVKFKIWYRSLPMKKALRDYEIEKQQQKK
jgi:hypothetical protein